MKRSVARSFLLPLVAGLLLAGCNKQGPEPPVVSAGDGAGAGAPAGEAASPRPLPPAPPLPEASPNAVAVGSALGAEGAVQSPLQAYGQSATVYASVPTAGHDAGDTITVYWTHSDGMVDKQERKPVPAGASYVNFSFSGADGMRQGAYNVQADVNDVPVGIADFNVE